MNGQGGPGSRTPLFLGVALAVGVAVVATGLALARGSTGPPAGKPSPPPTVGTPVPSLQTPAAVFLVHPPPTDRQLLWFEINREQSPLAIRLHATDWEGHEVGTMAFPCQAPCWVNASPDGQRVLVGEQPPEGQAPAPDTVFDATGTRIGMLDGGGPAAWADDSRHLCVLRNAVLEATPAAATARPELDLVDSTASTSRIVATVVGMSPGYLVDWVVLACSVSADRAVLSLDGQQGEHAVRVLQLSSGRTLHARDDQPPDGPCGCPVKSLAVDHDGTVALETLTQGGVRLRDLSTGAIPPWTAASAMRSPVFGLSWNGRRALTADGVADVATAHILWRPPSEPGYLVAARPGSDDVLVGVTGSSGNPEYIVRNDGTEVDLPASYFRP